MLERPADRTERQRRRTMNTNETALNKLNKTALEKFEKMLAAEFESYCAKAGPNATAEGFEKQVTPLMMADRRAADRARKARCRRREGLRVLHIVVHERRLVAALRAAGRLGEDCPAVEALTAEAREVLADFADRWLEKKRARDDR
jgi:hypothetical protein